MPNESNERLDRYNNYFKDDLEALEKEIKKSEGYSAIIEKEIEQFTQKTGGAFPVKGSQHYLIEHIKNAVSLQSQKQSLLKDKVSIKKIIMDYSEKGADGGDFAELQREIMKLTSQHRQVSAPDSQTPTVGREPTEEELEEIDSILDEYADEV